jgi:hypothetical protein
MDKVQIPSNSEPSEYFQDDSDEYILKWRLVHTLVSSSYSRTEIHLQFQELIKQAKLIKTNPYAFLV